MVVQHPEPTQRELILPVLEIPKPGHEEAYKLACKELQIFTNLLEDLSPEDWSRPTNCTLWDTRQIVAHLAGSGEAALSFKNFKRQVASKELKRFTRQGFKGIDATNQLQVDDRRDYTPAQLLSEIKRDGPRAIYKRYKLPVLLQALPLYIPILGLVQLNYLTDVIPTRDMWMHRLDICQATGREMVLSPEHDGRIVALIVREWAKRKRSTLKGLSVNLELKGLAGGRWRIGEAAEPEVKIEMAALDFTLLASERLTIRTLNEQNLVTVSGDPAKGKLVLENIVVPF